MIAERLKVARERTGHSQRSLAEALDMGVNQIWRYENGKTIPSGDDVAKIAIALEVSTDYLLGMTDEPSPNLSNVGLSEFEVRVLSALRSGNSMRAIQVIATQNQSYVTTEG